MKKITFILSFVFICSIIFGQTPQTKICATEQYMQYMEKLRPGFIQATEEAFQQAKLSQQGIQEKSTDVYRIPVVVHIVYNTPEQNLADSVILDQIRVLNEDFNRMNSDSANLRDVFNPYAGSLNVQFELADFDPDGNPTSGITRTQTTHATFAGTMMEMMSGDMSKLERVKSTADGGIDPWNQSQYLNIWVCNMAINIGGQSIPMLLGYATPPANLPNWPPGSVGGLSDGVVIQYQVVGSNNPNTFSMGGQGTYNALGRTTVHEIGHYLGLRHIWADDQSCTVDDGISDTPNATDQSQQDCDTTKNTCVDNIGGVDLPDMIENHMDYSSEECKNTFTKGQAALMKGVLDNQRWDLTHNNPALGLSENKFDFNASLYPNPSSSFITLTTDKYLNGTVSVSDATGKIIQKVQANNTNKITIDINRLQKGIYFVTLTNTSKVLKFIKK